MYHYKYIKYKQKYLQLKQQQSGGENLIATYPLIGIGDFSHGCENIWNYRFDLLKKAIDETDKSVNIFIEDNQWHCDNIMNDKKILLEEPIMYDNRFPAGKLRRYINHVWESNILFEIITYIRENKKRIIIYGVDPAP